MPTRNPSGPGRLDPARDARQLIERLTQLVTALRAESRARGNRDEDATNRPPQAPGAGPGGRARRPRRPPC